MTSSYIMFVWAKGVSVCEITMTSVHTKTNLSCKCLAFERVIAGAAAHFDLAPSDLVVVDLCSSHAKDLYNLETLGIQSCHYFGFDNDVDSPGLAQKHHRSSLNLVTRMDLVHASDASIHEGIRAAMTHPCRVEASLKAHIVIINFAIHLFAHDLEKVFRLASTGAWAHSGCFLQCSYISLEGMKSVVEAPHAFGLGVAFNAETRTLFLEGMATYAFDEGLRHMVPTILREDSAHSFANNGVAEHIVSDDAIVVAAKRHSLDCVCAPDELSHAKLYHDCIRMHVAVAIPERTRTCLEAFMTLHKTLIVKHNDA